MWKPKINEKSQNFWKCSPHFGPLWIYYLVTFVKFFFEENSAKEKRYWKSNLAKHKVTKARESLQNSKKRVGWSLKADTSHRLDTHRRQGSSWWCLASWPLSSSSVENDRHSPSSRHRISFTKRVLDSCTLKKFVSPSCTYCQSLSKDSYSKNTSIFENPGPKLFKKLKSDVQKIKSNQMVFRSFRKPI